MDKQRGITVHFTDGNKIQLDFPAQAENDYGSIIKYNEIVKERQLAFEVDGTLLLMPFDNIKYIQVHPVSSTRLPPNVIRGAKVSE